jgi:hypothetical protein
MVISKAMLHVDPEIAKRRIIRSLREMKPLEAERKRLEAERRASEAELRTQETEDHEMREIFAMTAVLSKEMGFEFEIPPDWR